MEHPKVQMLVWDCLPEVALPLLPLSYSVFLLPGFFAFSYSRWSEDTAESGTSCTGGHNIKRWDARPRLPTKDIIGRGNAYLLYM